ncbi:MAG: substrate-binding domain-containing protein [Prosthecobacter sp.]|uniref:substrate-binding domain-containing protein n=1 Tax=Prosthecobacter sp. TaxID=1965333 RepID=UPI0038FE75E4
MFPPKPQLPRRASLPLDVAAFLRERLLRGDWARVLPGETELARELQVGRNTIRAALAVLEKDGLIRTASGKRREVVGKVKKLRRSMEKVAVMLLPVPWHTLAPSTLLWMDALRARLQGAGWQLQLVVDAAAFRRAPAATLESLVSRHPSAVWILFRSTAAMQHWFEKRQVCTVVAGSCHPGVSLPQVDMDFRATSRHAAARLAGLGHRRLAVLAPAVSFAGDDESLAGFREGAGDAFVQVHQCNDSKASVIKALRVILTDAQSPTAIFAFQGAHAATALTYLSQQGVSVPAQMSLLSRDHEPFLAHLVPEPARYERQPEVFAKKLAHLVTALGDGVPPKKAQHLLMPTFVRGETLGGAPVPTKNR